MPSIVDIAGRRFGRLVAIAPTTGRTDHGGLIWRCQCDCGNTVAVPYNSLVYANQKSCGCRKKEHDQRLAALQTHVAGTSLEAIRSRKIPSDNTTGYRGVYFIRGKYVAKIVFQKKAYYVGTFDHPEDAAEARQAAEEALYKPTLEFYARWQERADKDPQWAGENPVQIFVSREDDRLRVAFLPELSPK